MRILSHPDLCNYLPHSGRMCLLHRIVSWTEVELVGEILNHTDTDNPLRHANCLPAISGVEYAAQAMAVHAGLLAEHRDTRPARGYLGSLSDAFLYVHYLDTIASPLRIGVTRLFGERFGAIYEFSLASGEHNLLQGRASVVLEYDPPP